MSSHHDPEERRLTALAYWRYAHDHLRAARTLCDRHRLCKADAQPNYHLAAQALEFALHAFLRAKGEPVELLERRLHHALVPSLDAALAHGLPEPPAHVRAAIVAIDPHHQPDRFLHVLHEADSFPDLRPLFDAVCWVLGAIVPDVAHDYTTHYSGADSPSTDVFINRLRADLSATASSGEVVLA